MKVTLVPSSIAAGGDPIQYLISYLIDDTVAVDAGCLGFHGTPEDQARVAHVVLSHTHADHTASLPIFVENAYEAKADCVNVHASATVLDAIRTDMFNGRTWPDFVTMSTDGTMAPFLRLVEIEAGRPFDLPGLRVTPIAVDHLVPTLGFLIESGDVAVLIPSDTAPTEEIWRVARATPGLKAVFLEASFPDSMAELAGLSKHLTPATLAVEVDKLGRPEVEIIVVHIKPRFRRQIIEELKALNRPNLSIGRFDRPYLF